MSAVVRDVWRYHHWPLQRDFWSRQHTSSGEWTHRSAPDEIPQGVSGDFVGYDNRISPQNLERVRYHHWPDRRQKRNPIWDNQSPRYNYAPQRQSERQEYDFMHSNNITTLTAPFGTNDTPNISYKIIGGKPVHVIESLQPQRLQDSTVYTGPRIHNLDGVTIKPNQVNPRVLNEKAKGYYSAQQHDDHNEEKYTGLPKLVTLDQFSSQVHGKPTYSNPVTYRGPRPDSKTLNPFPNLPPIEANRGKNQKSTVFAEKEAWIPSAVGEPKLSTQTEYKLQYENGRPNSERYEPTYQNNNSDFVNQNDPRKAYSETGGPTMERSFKDSMLHLLPPEPFLPSDPVKYSSEQRQRLLDLTAEEMRGVSTDRLKGAYHLLSRIDRQLNGFCQFENVKEILKQERADPSESTLRLIAAMCVVPKVQNMVNYEDIITFLNEAVRVTQNGVKPISIPREKETALLLHKTAQQLGTSKINIETLIRTFQLYDHERTEMLSANEIKNVLFDNKIQLSESLTDDILAKMSDANRDGKYNWRRFVDFLERVQPARTGLEITYNKRPLEYAKQFPQPVDSWPRARESPRYSSPPPANNYQYGSRSPLSPRKNTSYSNSSRIGGPSGPSNDIWRKIQDIEDEIRNLEQNNQPNKNRQSEKDIYHRIATVQDEINDLEFSNKFLKQGMESNARGDSWEAKLIQLGGQLYRLNETRYRSSGVLPFEFIVDQTTKYNENARMGLPYDVIYRLAQRYSNDRNQVDIDRYLNDLGNDRTWYAK
ncbi:uncharacterized protein LOC125669838 isoform X5 [Ostrea edulis]|uniref:uncharacterized protein LOC125669838 isoform X5 n=1 Tax=Ostrea edulis TaxID=37623 RepID=UPI002095A9B8|nr:uncharacterized protein LOC125669838 isoform X5 [Ostrea edulis]